MQQPYQQHYQQQYQQPGAGVDGATVCVKNIPFEATEEELLHLFGDAGTIISFNLKKEKETGKSRGFGFCKYKDAASAESAIRNLNNKMFKNRPLFVEPYRPRAPGAPYGMGQGSQQPTHGASQHSGSSSMMGHHSRSSHSSHHHGQHQQQGRYQGMSSSYHQPMHSFQRTRQDQQRHRDDMSGQPATKRPHMYGRAEAPGKNMERAIHTIESAAPSKVYQVLLEIKRFAIKQPGEAHKLLTSQPQLCFAILRALKKFDLVDTDTMNRLLNSAGRRDTPARASSSSTGGATRRDMASAPSSSSTATATPHSSSVASTPISSTAPPHSSYGTNDRPRQSRFSSERDRDRDRDRDRERDRDRDHGSSYQPAQRHQQQHQPSSYGQGSGYYEGSSSYQQHARQSEYAPSTIRDYGGSRDYPQPHHTSANPPTSSSASYTASSHHQPPQPQASQKQPPSIRDLDPRTRRALDQVLKLSDEELSKLPPERREKLIQLKKLYGPK